MSKGWDEMKDARENEYFEKENKAALERLKTREQKPRLSPITGEAMIQRNIFGVLVDQCPTSKGIWLDAGELEELMQRSKQMTSGGSGSMAEFFSSLFGKK